MGYVKGRRTFVEGWTRRLAVVLMVMAGAALLTGCLGIKPRLVEGRTCNFDRYALSTFTPINTNGLARGLPGKFGESPPDALKQDPSAPQSLRQELIGRLSAASQPATGPARYDRSLLFLSGGSLHGAFGAGYLAEWKKNRKALPRYRVVTGISTGAILGSFAFADMPEIAADAYAITNEGRLLKRLIGFRDGDPTFFGNFALVKRGAVGDLDPLRSYLDEKLSDEVMAAVAQGHDDERRFYVGVVDVDTGQALALDMTEMAHRWQVAARDKDEAGTHRFKTCYVDAIIASSSAPMAALPVFIDNRMYVDGGMRFGAFSEEIGQILPPLSDKPALLKTVPKDLAIHLIVNGYQTVPSKCGRASKDDCKKSLDVKGGEDWPNSNARHRKWEFIELALRSEGILANQVYRFSAESLYYKALFNDVAFTYAQIGDEALDHTWPGDAAFPGEMTCRKAKQLDKAESDPVQFFPRYMHCIIDYGRMRARQDFPPAG